MDANLTDMAKRPGTSITGTDGSAIDIGIAPKHREKISQGLSRLLADTYTLYLQTHNFHWNVEGPMFNTLHEMFMTQYSELWTALDAIAERIRSLGTRRPAPTRPSPACRRSGRSTACRMRWRWYACW
jgi:starvation-inducible DNA-binding protein